MAGYRFLDLVTEVEGLSSITSERAMVQRLINSSIAKIASAWSWPFLWTWDFFATDDDITAGDADVTNGSNSVTSDNGSTSWPATVVGRKFRIGSQNAYYTIDTRVSSTSITLDQNYQGDTATDQSYTIYQDEYLLRADVDYPKLLRQIENGIPMLSLSPGEFDMRIPTPEATGDPSYETFIGRNVGTYTTGTVAMTSGSRTLTGSSTAWTSARGLSRGSKIQIGSTVFTVDTVDSDTQITTYEDATATISAGTSYVAIIDNPIVQIYPIPDTAQNIYYRFQRVPAVVDADQDIPDLPHPMHRLIIFDTMRYLWMHKGMLDRMAQTDAIFEKELQRAIIHYGHASGDRTYAKRSSDLRSFRFPTHPLIKNF